MALFPPFFPSTSLILSVSCKAPLVQLELPAAGERGLRKSETLLATLELAAKQAEDVEQHVRSSRSKQKTTAPAPAPAPAPTKGAKRPPVAYLDDEEDFVDTEQQRQPPTSVGRKKRSMTPIEGVDEDEPVLKEDLPVEDAGDAKKSTALLISARI